MGTKDIFLLVWDLRRYPSLCCSGSERRRICTPKWATPHLHFGFGCRRASIISTHVSSVSHVSQSSSWHSSVSHVSQSSSWHSSVSHVSQSSRGTWSSRCMQRRRHTLRTTPTHRHTTHNGRLSRTIGHRAANNSPHRWGGGRIPHTPEQHRHLTRQRSLDVAGALPSVLSRFSPVQLSESEIAVDLER